MVRRLAKARFAGRSARWAIFAALFAIPAFAQLPLPLPTLPIALPPPLGSPSSTPTAAPTVTGTPEITPTAGPAEEGGAVTVIDQADSFGSGGQTVNAGTF